MTSSDEWGKKGREGRQSKKDDVKRKILVMMGDDWSIDNRMIMVE